MAGYDAHYDKAKKEAAKGASRTDMYLLAGKYEKRGDKQAAQGIRDALTGRSRRR